MRFTKTTATSLEDEHIQVSRVLPWYVNGTLDDAERATVTEHLASCLRCRREIALLKTLQSTIISHEVDPQCEAALTRLHARIETAAAPRASFPWAAAAVLVIVAGVAAVAMVNSGFTKANNTYVTLGARAIAVDESDRMFKARIVFDQDLTELQLRQLLLGSHAELIDGPTERGTYTIALPAIRDASELHTTLARLRLSRRVIFVEPIVSLGARDPRD